MQPIETATATEVTDDRPLLLALPLKNQPSPPTDHPPLSHLLPEQTSEDIAFRHSGWQPRRAKTLEALLACGLSPARLERFQACGNHAWLYQHQTDPSRLRIVCDACHDRFCLPCSRSRAATVCHNLQDPLNIGPTRMVTLGLKRDDLPLADRIRRLYASFRRLRHRSLWSHAVTGGVAFLEITRGADGNHWHVHLHVLCKGSYLPHDDLTDEWLAVTGDSHVVDIRIVRDTATSARYVTKYATKALDSSVYATDDTLQEAMIALQGVRTVLTFGTFNNLRLTETPVDCEWVVVASLASLRTRAANGDAQAAELLERISTTCNPTTTTATARANRPP